MEIWMMLSIVLLYIYSLATLFKPSFIAIKPSYEEASIAMTTFSFITLNLFYLSACGFYFYLMVAALLLILIRHLMLWFKLVNSNLLEKIYSALCYFLDLYVLVFFILAFLNLYYFIF